MERSKEKSEIIGGALNTIAECLYSPEEHGDKHSTKVEDIVGISYKNDGTSDYRLKPWYDCTLAEWLCDLCYEILVYNGIETDIENWIKWIK